MNRTPIIEKVLTSKTFQNKEVLKGLLKFIYEEGQKGNSLKEADIAIGYFKRGNEFIPGEDTIVRVNVYKLRSLLEKYYAEEGGNENELIEIPKGKYCLVIKRKEEFIQVQKEKKRFPLILPILLLFSVTLNVCLLYSFLDRNALDSSVNPVWASYIKSGQPVYVTLGDPFFFRIKSTKYPSGSLIARDIAINSKEDLEANIQNSGFLRGAEISELNYPYFSRNNLWPLPNIISTFAKASVETRLQTLSEASIDDIKNNNVIFIANINSFGWMNEFLKRTSFRLYTNPRKIVVKRPDDSLTLTVPEYVKGKYEDYAFLVKLPGSNNNTITLMGDFHPSGLRGLSSFLYSSKSLIDLKAQAEKQYGHFPEYFEMLVKVTSYNYADFDTKLILFKSLE